MGLGAAVALLIVGVGVAIVVSMLSSAGGHSTVIPVNPAASADAKVPGAGGGAAPVYVHILGAVNSPGLYVLRDGDRTIDAIAAAGGFSEAADRGQVNLARFLSDGEQIYVPHQGEAVVSGRGGAPGLSGGKVNINTADGAALETLPRVGPALASRIIAWRETNGRFTDIADLKSVSGIGEKTFAGLKDRVTI